MLYDKLIDELRSSARLERNTAAADGFDAAHADLLDSAADTLEMLQEERGLLRARLSRLLRSRTIQRYDERTIKGEYAHDIDDLDKEVAAVDALRGRVIELEEQLEARVPIMPADTLLSPLFICDRRACDTCHPECMHTKDLRHAKHFEASECRNLFVEQEAI